MITGDDQMPLPDSLHGEAYRRNLLTWRNEALRKSAAIGTCSRLGKLILGRAQAQWYTESGGMAFLTHRRGPAGLLDVYHPTTLHVVESRESDGRNTGFAVLTFAMDLEGTNVIEACRRVRPTGQHSDIQSVRRSLHVELKNEMIIADTSLREILHNEMERGASGLYRPPAPNPSQT